MNQYLYAHCKLEFVQIEINASNLGLSDCSWHTLSRPCGLDGVAVDKD